MIKLSGVSATDSVPETSKETGLDLVHGDAQCRWKSCHSLKGYWMFNCVC